MPKKIVPYTKGDGELVSSGFVEISIDPDLLNNFSTEEGIGSFFTNQSLSEDFKELKKELIEEMMRIIEEYLTDKQKEVVKMTYVDGKTQNEISNKLGKHQTTIHKLLQGNIDYSNDKKRYGGALKKIRKLCSENEKIQEILKKMKEIREETSY